MSVIHTRDRLRRRLTSLYSDTKKSYETATVTSRPTANEDPDLKVLRRDYQIQKDRLLAWGLEWSEEKAAPSSEVEIDQAIDKAGLGPQAATVMSQIQKLLVDAEQLQNSRLDHQNRKSSAEIKDKKASANETKDDISEPRTLLSKLTSCIDKLYTLSTSNQTTTTEKGSAWGSKSSLSGIDAPMPDDVVQIIEESLQKDLLFVPPWAIHTAEKKAMDSETPPPYEEVIPMESTRVVGHLETSCLKRPKRMAFGLQKNHPTPIVVEYFTATGPAHEQRETVAKYAAQLSPKCFRQSRAHNGSLRLLGYTADAARSRYGMIYELPGGSRSYASGPLPPASSLRSIIPTKRDDADPPSPNLEDRFRLSFNIVLSLLQLAKTGFRHHDLNSSNVVLFTHPLVKGASNSKTGFRNPYLLLRPRFTRVASQHEPLHISLYRHATDEFPVGDDRPWSLDIYSLGLILLEIGLWIPVSRFWKSKYDKPTFTSRLKTNYVPKLASRCGAMFQKVVDLCMSAPENLSDDPRDRRSASECLLRAGADLARCCAIDFEGPGCDVDLQYYSKHLTAGSSTPSSTSSTLGDVPYDGYQDRADSAGYSSTGDVSSSMGDIGTPASAVRPAEEMPLKKWNDVDIPQENLDQWNSFLMPRISKLLQKALSSSRESCSASLMMVGSSPETAKTTICIQCTSVDQVRQSLRNGFRCKAGWGLLILKGEVRRSGKNRKSKQTQKDKRRRSVSPVAQKSKYQERPSFGASVGAFRDQEHLPPVSFGGVILVDGEHFGMTVHHMLDAPSDDEDEEMDQDEGQRSSATWSSSWDRASSEYSLHPTLSDDVDEIALSDSESESSTIRPDYIDVDSGNGAFWFSDEFEESPELAFDSGSDSGSEDGSDSENGDDYSEGDVCGIDEGEGEEIYVTQPALDDVEEDFFPCEADRDDDHLSSFSLGHIHASSGIRRVMAADIKHEVDWALIRIKDDRLEGRNHICQDPVRKRRTTRRRTQIEASSELPPNAKQLTSVAPCSSLARLHVQSHGRTSGRQSGRISAALALVRLHGRQSFSSSWVVEGGGFGIPGDSGAWIYEAESGQLCGHVLAWGSQSKTAYMAPMEVLFDDIKKTLGAETVELPCDSQLIVGAKGQAGKMKSAANNPHHQGRPSLEVDLARLKLDTAQNKLPTPPSTTTATPTSKDIPESFSLKGSRQSDLQEAVKVG